MTNTIDLDKLEQVAEAIEHGLWGYGGLAYTDVGASYYHVYDDVGNDVLGEYGADEKEASYIAAACPAIVLELIRRLRAAEAENAELRTRPSGEQIGIIAVKLIRENATDDSDDQFLAGRACGIGHMHTELLKHMIAAQGASHD